MQVSKLKFKKAPIESVIRPTQFGEKVLEGGKSLLELAVVATLSTILTAVFRDAINTRCKDTREYGKQTLQYIRNEVKARD